MAFLSRRTSWRVSNSQDIEVFKDPWLNDDNNFFIDSIPLPALETMKVNDLFMVDEHAWNK